MFSTASSRTPSYPSVAISSEQQQQQQTSSKLNLHGPQPSLTAAAAKGETQSFATASKSAASKASLLKYESLPPSASLKYDSLPALTESNLEQPEHSYHGQIKDGLFHGKGKLTYNTNERYEV